MAEQQNFTRGPTADEIESECSSLGQTLRSSFQGRASITVEFVDDSFAFWYPTWETWQFRRTLSYWIAVLYLEGSILFTTGAAFSMTNLIEKSERLEYALVGTPYFIGSICFTLGSYVGVFEVINVPNKEGGKVIFLPPRGQQWKELTSIVSWQAVYGYMAYTIGAVFFNINTVAGFYKMTFVEIELLSWGTGIAGSLGFVIGGIAESSRNRFWEYKVNTIEWQLCFWNLVGGVAFLVACVAGACKVPHELEIDLVNLSYVIGSASFWVGSTCALWMWKCEDYGLGFLPEMNAASHRVQELPEKMENMHAQYGCGRASAWQMPFLTMYLVNASAAVLDIGLAINEEQSEGSGHKLHRLLEASLNFALSHGVMLLGSVVHHIPTARPHSWLLIYMRIVLAFYTVNSWLNVLANMDSFLHS